MCAHKGHTYRKEIEMLTVLDKKLTIYTRKSLYGDWRDWFIIDDNQTNIHETFVKIYFDKELITEIKVPINIKKLHSDIQIKTDADVTIERVVYLIPEMGLIKEIEAVKILFAGDTATFNSELFFYE
jgi:hypothetical protein